MTIAAIVRLSLAGLANCALAGLVFAQQDVQITSEAINRACADIHHTPNVTAEPPTIRGPRDVTLNCRLIGTNGHTIAQVSPAEVCQRLTGSTEWYRGMGTQVFCRATDVATPAPRSFTVTEEDIAKACQRMHRNPQATAAPTTIGRDGIELNCRLINQNGVVLARVSPEDVCETKFGTREWMRVAGSTTFVCKGTPTVAQPNRPPVAGQTPVAGEVNDVPLTPEAVAKGCQALHGASATAGQVTHGPTATQVAGIVEPTIRCNTAGGVVSHKAAEFCPHVSGTSGWYVTDFGRGTWMPGETVAAAPRINVCRGPGPLQYHALADIGRYCIGKGFDYGNYGTGAGKAPVCFKKGVGQITPIGIADICRDIHRASSYERRGMVYFCRPAGAPSPAL